MTGDDPHGPWTFDDPWMTTHPDRPLVDDASAAVLDEAVVELTLLRSPMSLGDGLADLHAMTSLLAQLRAWMPLSVAAARKHEHTWEAIGRQLGDGHHREETAPSAHLPSARWAPTPGRRHVTPT